MSRVLPILFNTDMVRAILDGRKTVTRRCVKFLNGKNPNWTGYVKDGLMLYNGTNESCIKPCQYQPGDILYVREAWKLEEFYDDEALIRFRAGGEISMDYECEGDTYSKLLKYVDDIGWIPSLFMPKEAARIWLKVNDVRVERLQEITEEQAEKEGCNDYTSTALGFCYLWNSTIKKSDLDLYGWDANPWVWVIEFERCEKPE